MIEKHIQVLNVNPFFCSLILQAFYKGYDKSQCEVLIHYLILPILLFNETRKPLTEINIKTNFEKYIESNKIHLLELQEKIWNFKDLTNQTLIYLHNHNKIKLDAKVEVLEEISYENYTDDLKSFLRAAHYWGFLLSKIDTITVYKSLKVIP